MVETAGVEQHDPAADVLEFVLDLEVVEPGLRAAGSPPAAGAGVGCSIGRCRAVDRAALGLGRIDAEGLVERPIGGAHAQVPAQHHEPFPHAVDQLLGELAAPLQIEQQPFPLGDVGNGEQDAIGRAGAGQAARIEHHALRPIRSKSWIDAVILHPLAPAQHLFEQPPQRRDVPLPVAELVQLAPDRLLAPDAELLEECGIGELDRETVVEHQERLGDRRQRSPPRQSLLASTVAGAVKSPLAFTLADVCPFQDGRMLCWCSGTASSRARVQVIAAALTSGREHG